jgi:virginiamycin B lyase
LDVLAHDGFFHNGLTGTTTVQLNFTGLGYEVDGKVWTKMKSVRTQHFFRLDLATNKWERFHPTDYLPEGMKNAGIYQVMGDSQNNLWMAEFTEGHLGKIDAETTTMTWYPMPTAHARAVCKSTIEIASW